MGINHGKNTEMEPMGQSKEYKAELFGLFSVLLPWFQF